MTILKFSGEVAEFYQRYRRGYPVEVFDLLVVEFGLSTEDTALDLGCGTGQLTRPLAARTRSVIGMDPEPDMLAQARKVASGLTNVNWLVGVDSDVPALRTLLGRDSLGVVTIGQALHWMEHATLFPALRSLLRPGGGVAVLTNGAPMWLHESSWSKALREYLSGWLGQPLVRTCGTGQEEQDRYRASLEAAGFATGSRVVAYEDEIDLDFVIGAVYSATPEDRLPKPAERRHLPVRAVRGAGPGTDAVRQKGMNRSRTAIR